MHKESKLDKHYWYVRHNGRISGPFSSGHVSRQVLLGRINKDDELSHDLKSWQILKQLPELIPTVMKADLDDPVAVQRLAAARRWADDRDYTHPALLIDEVFQEHYDARDKSSQDPQQLDTRITEKLQEKRRERWNNNLFALLMMIIIAAVIGYYFSIARPVSDEKLGCSAPPASGVNWNNCFMQGASLSGLNLAAAHMMNANFTAADFSHANLSSADLRYSILTMVNAESVRLESAILIGANLNGAVLRNADMRKADLSYVNLVAADLRGADLSGARLDNARWVDGRICAPDSLSRCN